MEAKRISGSFDDLHVQITVNIYDRERKSPRLANNTFSRVTKPMNTLSDEPYHSIKILLPPHDIDDDKFKISKTTEGVEILCYIITPSKVRPYIIAHTENLIKFNNYNEPTDKKMMLDVKAVSNTFGVYNLADSVRFGIEVNYSGDNINIREIKLEIPHKMARYIYNSYLNYHMQCKGA
jgi:hypothetical protein